MKDMLFFIILFLFFLFISSPQKKTLVITILIYSKSNHFQWLRLLLKSLTVRNNKCIKLDHLN